MSSSLALIGRPIVVSMYKDILLLLNFSHKAAAFCPVYLHMHLSICSHVHGNTYSYAEAHAEAIYLSVERECVDLFIYLELFLVFDLSVDGHGCS